MIKPEHYVPSPWWEDPDKVLWFAQWYWHGSTGNTTKEILDYFEKPWEWDDERKAWKEEK